MKLWLGAFQESALDLLRNWFRPSRIAWAMIVYGIFLVVLSLAMGAPGVSAQPPLQEAEDGKAVFDQKCAGCHSIGGGKLIGPDLQGVMERRDQQWVKNFMANTSEMLATDPIAKDLLKEYNNVSMPNMNLTNAEIDQLIKYFENPNAVPASQAPVIPAGMGDPAAGRRLFTGEQVFTNGGPHCLACHNVSGLGSLGGGGLGPDLTHAIQRLGEPGLAGSLKTIVYPTMLGPFENRPLTESEQADLIAFLKEADLRQPPVDNFKGGAFTLDALLVLSVALVVAGVLFGLLWFFWARLNKRGTPHLPVRKV